MVAVRWRFSSPVQSEFTQRHYQGKAMGSPCLDTVSVAVSPRIIAFPLSGVLAI